MRLLMKAFCQQKDFLDALNIVGRAISAQSTLPVLQNILIRAQGKNLFFASTNLEVAIRYFIECDVRNEGAITVPAKLLINYISLLPDEKLEITTEEGLHFSIKSKTSQTKIKGVHIDEFPVIPEIEKGIHLNIPAKDLQEAMDQVVFAAAQNTSRPVLSGILFSLEKNILKLVSTDSYRLAERKITLKDSVPEKLQCIIPSKTATELGKLATRSPEGFVQVEVSKNQILFKIGNIDLISRLIDGKFPEYERIIPKTSKTKIEALNSALTQVVKRVSLFARENNNSIKLSATNDGKLTVFTDETKVGEERADIDISMEGENTKVSLNAQYLLDVLSAMKDEKLCVELNDKSSPVIVRSIKESQYIYIIMPLKV